MNSQQRTHRIVTKLGKLEKVLKDLEKQPSLNGYSTTIRNGRYVLRSAMKDLAKKSEHKINWNVVAQVLQFLVNLYISIRGQA